MGAAALKQLLANIDFVQLSDELRVEAASKSKTKRDDAIKRLKIVESFKKSQMDDFLSYYEDPEKKKNSDIPWAKDIAEKVEDFKYGVIGAGLYVTGSDLWEHTLIKDGFDPEAKIAGSGTAFYPFTRNITVGVNLTF